MVDLAIDKDVYLTTKVHCQSVCTAGELLKCEVELGLNSTSTNRLKHTWSITEVGGFVVGLYKLDDKLLTNLNLTAPQLLSFETSIQNLITEKSRFNTEHLFAPIFKSDNNKVFYASFMQRKPCSDFISEPVIIWLCLPHNLPPSVRGSLFKIGYKLVIAIQLCNFEYLTDNFHNTSNNNNQKVHFIQSSLRILPSSRLFYSLRTNLSYSNPHSDQVSSDFMVDNPFWISNADRNENLQWTLNTSSNANNFMRSDSETLQQEQQLTDDLPMNLIKTAGQIRTNLFAETMGSQYLDINHLKEQTSNDSKLKFSQIVASSQPANFVVSCPRGLVGRLSFSRTLYSVGDLIRGYFDFSQSTVSCLNCIVRLESLEQYLIHSKKSKDFESHESEKRTFQICLATLDLDKNGEPLSTEYKCPDNARHITTWTEISLTCVSQKLLPFTLPIPTNLTSQFHAITQEIPYLALDYRWRLHLEFELICNYDREVFTRSVGSNSDGKKTVNGTTWVFPASLKTEKMNMDLPVQLVISNPSVINNFVNSFTQSICVANL